MSGRISVSLEQKKELEKIKKEHGCKNQEEVLELLLTAFNNRIDGIDYNHLDLKVEQNNDSQVILSEIDIVRNAVENSEYTLQQIVHDGTIQRAKYINAIAEKAKQFDKLSDEELKSKTVSGAAYLRLENAVDKISEYNDTQESNKTRFWIGATILFKLTGSNRKTIQSFVEDYQDKIDSINNKHNLTVSDNRKGKGFDIKNIIEL